MPVPAFHPAPDAARLARFSGRLRPLLLDSVALAGVSFMAGRGAGRGFDIAIGAMPATTAAAVSATVQVSSGKHVEPVFDVIIPTFDEW
jgi:hypothetical protein